jgi:hypothetical protein
MGLSPALDVMHRQMSRCRECSVVVNADSFVETVPFLSSGTVIGLNYNFHHARISRVIDWRTIVGGWLEEWRRDSGLFSRLRISVLCRRDIPINSAREAIGWWEARRIPYNLIVGSAGVTTCIIVAVISAAASILLNVEFGLPNPPMFALVGIVLYGIAANICFTGGWLAELIVRKISPREADRFASWTFTLGLVFSVLLTLAPAVLIGAVGFFGLLRHLIHLRHG